MNSQLRLQRLRREDSVLLIVDVQERLSPAMCQAAAFIAHCVILARAARQLALPILLTEQNPARLGSTLEPLREVLGEVAPVAKMLFSACTPQVLQALEQSGRKTVLLCGNEAHICVLQSALDLREAGYSVFAAHDAIASQVENDKNIGWQRMMEAGIVPTTTQSAVFELLREAGTPDFKALLPFLK